MTATERRLAIHIVVIWMFLSVCTSALRISGRLMHQQAVYPVAALSYEMRWLFQGVAAAVLAIDLWRSRGRRFRYVRTAAAWVILYAASAAAYIVFVLPLKRWVWPEISLRAMATYVALADLVFFFILALGTIAATLLVEAQQMATAARQEAAALESHIAEVRLRNLRTQVQPHLITEALGHLEQMLADDPRRAEAALLNLSDFLRLALARASGIDWTPALESEYGRRESEVLEELRA